MRNGAPGRKCEAWLLRGPSLAGRATLMALLGGMHTVRPDRGGGIIIAMQNCFASFSAWVTVLQGTIFVIAVLLFREGIVGVIARWLKRPL